jgi:hypothetical protein
MRYEEILGSEAYIRRLIELAASLDQTTDPDFIVVPPGGELRQADFLDR